MSRWVTADDSRFVCGRCLKRSASGTALLRCGVVVVLVSSVVDFKVLVVYVTTEASCMNFEE